MNDLARDPSSDPLDPDIQWVVDFIDEEFADMPAFRDKLKADVLARLQKLTINGW